MRHFAEVVAYACAITFMVGFTAFVVGGIVWNVIGWCRSENDKAGGE